MGVATAVGKAVSSAVQSATKGADKKDSKDAKDAKDKDKKDSNEKGRNGEGGSENKWWENIFPKDKNGKSTNPDKLYEDLKKKSDGIKAGSLNAGVGNSTQTYDKAKKNDLMYNTNLNYISQIATPASLFGIGGMPAVFLNNTDPPSALNSQGLGSYYLEQNIKHGQFVVFKPGFLTWGIGKDEATEIASGNAAGALMGVVAKLFTGKLTDLRPSLDDYWFDVERSMRLAIYMMGLDKAWFPFQMGGEGVSKGGWGDRLGNQGGGSMSLSYCTFGQMTRKNWRNIGLKLANLIANKHYHLDLTYTGTGKSGNQDAIQDVGLVPFYVNGNVEVTENISNGTSNNPLSEALSQITGEGDNKMKQMIGMVGWGGRSIESSSLGFFTGQPLMPQVWSNTTIDKSYSFSLRLTTPSGDPVSYLMNVLYPTIKLMHLALPLGVGGFQTSPSVVSIFSLGTMNIKYGMITSLNIQKNMQTLSDNGLPTEVDIQVSCVDLNPHIYKERPGWFRTSIEIGNGFSNFIATMCGINVTVIPDSYLQKYQNELRKIDENFNGRIIFENGVFAVQNFISKFARNWNNGEIGGKYLSVSEKIKGMFGFGKNYVPRATMSGQIAAAGGTSANDTLTSAPPTSVTNGTPMGTGVTNNSIIAGAGRFFK